MTKKARGGSGTKPGEMKEKKEIWGTFCGLSNDQRENVTPLIMHMATPKTIPFCMSKSAMAKFSCTP